MGRMRQTCFRTANSFLKAQRDQGCPLHRAGIGVDSSGQSEGREVSLGTFLVQVSFRRACIRWEDALWCTCDRVLSRCISRVRINNCRTPREKPAHLLLFSAGYCERKKRLNYSLTDIVCRRLLKGALGVWTSSS
jgi:hypothetical protein